MCALQHEHASSRAPRPLPLFLELVRIVAQHDPAMARTALDGLARYETIGREPAAAAMPVWCSVGGVTVRDYGGEGPPVLLVPSLINPPRILDLDADVSLARAIGRMGRRVLLVDWGEAGVRSKLGIAQHVETLLVPIIRRFDTPPALVGYCLGGTMAIAAANCAPVERVATLAAPWNFSGYPEASRASLRQLWNNTQVTSAALGALPMEVLQGAFWSLDPERTVKKFADFAALDPASPQARRFVTLEDWANEGEPLPCPAARELIEDLFGADLPGEGSWTVGGKIMSDRLDVPAIHLTAAHDRITPAATAPAGEVIQIESGHVGMIVGSKRRALHQALAGFLDPACRSLT